MIKIEKENFIINVAGNSSLALPYTYKLSAVSTAFEALDIASVVFTVDWNQNNYVLAIDADFHGEKVRERSE